MSAAYSPQLRHPFVAQILVEAKTRTYHGRVGTRRRTAIRRGWAGTGKTGRRRVGSPRRVPARYPPDGWKKNLGVSLEAQTKETLCKPMGTKPAVDNRFIAGLRAGPQPLFVPGC